MCPTNDGTFQSVCTSATLVDIVTLDYTVFSRGIGLGYKITSKEVKTATDRGMSFEIPIAPALLHLKRRKALIQACYELIGCNVGRSTTIRVIGSSGNRYLDGKDVGSLALR